MTFDSEGDSQLNAMDLKRLLSVGNMFDGHHFGDGSV